MEPQISQAIRNDSIAAEAMFEFERGKRDAERSLLEYTKQGWSEVDPNPFSSNWHVECVCDHLEAVANQQILRLLINIPPRHMKSLGTNVFFPSWVWAQDPNPDNDPDFKGSIMPETWRGPGVKFVYISYDADLSTDHSVKCRQLMQSPYYQERWGDRFEFRKDENQKTVYENTAGGKRISGGITSVTGKGGDIIVYDDPHDILKVDYDNNRKTVITFWTEQLPNRLNSTNGAFIVVMQRTHSRDLSGYILAKEMGAQFVDLTRQYDERKKFVHICFPARFESKHPTPMKSPVIRKGTIPPVTWTDPRTVEGEALWETRFPIAELDEREKDMTSHAIAGQMQQRPVAREGGKFKRSWFTEDKFLEAHEVPAGTRFVRHWDLAGSIAVGSDWTAGVKLGLMPNGCYVVASVIRNQFEGHDVRDLIKATAALDGYQCDISLPQDPGQSGKIQASDFVRSLAGYIVTTERETGLKTKRADPVAAQAFHGNLYLVRAIWNEAFLDELCLFPSAPNDDQVDGLSGAFARFIMQKGEFSVGGLG